MHGCHSNTVGLSDVFCTIVAFFVSRIWFEYRIFSVPSSLHQDLEVLESKTDRRANPDERREV